MKNSIRLMTALVLMAALIASPIAMAFEATPVPEYTGDPIQPVQPVISGDSKAAYVGTLRIFMSEPVSRYTDRNNAPYEFGFLRFADVAAMNINTGEVYTHQVTWDASDAGFTGVSPDNLVAQAVLYDPAWHTRYSDPPTGSPFFAYWVDAAAQAEPGLPGQDVKSIDFTHTVFVEVCTQKY